MSFGSGDARKRPGIFDSFRAALTPPALPVDDGTPIVPPRGVTVASVLAILGGLIFLITGAYSLATMDQQLDLQVTAYNAAISECTTQFGGIGDAVIAPAGAASGVAAKADTCKQYQPLTSDLLSAARTQNIMVLGALVVIGLVAVAGGWFVRRGAWWARLAIIGAVVLSVLLTLGFQVATLLTLIATMVLIVAVMMCYIGRGAVYFGRLKARRKG